ncbi:DNA replication and repair protein RecF [Prosthecochloris sp. CIB 2401]|nr:DNA replication and repair protein RecF [Prosthecochloris sp. CIB 2401]
MQLQEIRIRSFRSHKDTLLACSGGINLIHGPNGAGKTNILDAMHFCALSRSMQGSQDRECIAFASDHFYLHAGFEADTGFLSSVQVSYATGGEKKIQLNGTELNRFSELVGRIPCVTFFPAELAIVNGAPGERRRFLDTAICQVDRRYLDALQMYRKVVQQRNALLNHGMYGALEVLTEQMVVSAACIMRSRYRFIASFIPLVQRVYETMGIDEQPGIVYKGSVHIVEAMPDEDRLRALLARRFEEVEPQERLRKQTLAGPHRDDIMFTLNGRDVKKYASQGQMRTLLICLKIALQRYLKEISGETPLFLLDDLFSELDNDRMEAVVSLVGMSGQSVITGTEPLLLDHVNNINIHEIQSTEKAG